MTYQEVADMAESIGVPSAYYQFKETQQGPPYVCFFFTNSSDFLADDNNYQKIEHLAVELYTDEKDFTLEKTAEAVFNQNGLVYTKGEEYLDSESMHVTVYEMDVVITEGDTNGE